MNLQAFEFGEAIGSGVCFFCEKWKSKLYFVGASGACLECFSRVYGEERPDEN